jgi:hypothetical protein
MDRKLDESKSFVSLRAQHKDPLMKKFPSHSMDLLCDCVTLSRMDPKCDCTKMISPLSALFDEELLSLETRYLSHTEIINIIFLCSR